MIANDLTIENGSFGKQEGALFAAISKVARSTGVPFVYLSANTGARLELANMVADKFKVAFKNGRESDGVDYLYLSREDHAAVGGDDAVLCTEMPNGRMRIDAIVGTKHAEQSRLGVENLSSSGLLAGEMSAAYDETFTLTYVCGNAVGIGAYLVRLGQRSIQNVQHPLLLTGYKALNKLLGQKLYTSNLQLGGPSVMFTNGVSHHTVSTDLQGVQAIIRWLSFVPAKRGAPLPLIDVALDPPSRKIACAPDARGNDYDVIDLLAGRGSSSVRAGAFSDGASVASSLPGIDSSFTDGDTDDQSWVGGLLDRGSFVESLGGWAKSVVTGRGMLGGIPVGVIAVPVKPNLKVVPADPADPTSKEMIEAQSPQVWYPDSSYKTATAIRDFDRDGLPIIILANWRGFSGGTRDMQLEVLKFGSMIVDALRECVQPVMVYLPPGGELRGGAWVVLDTRINPDHIEKYADPTAHGGVLEPSGMVEVKFRRPQRCALMERTNEELAALRLKSETGDADATRKFREMQTKSYQVYTVASETLADLHDTAMGMESVGCIRQVVPWNEARLFFHRRLMALNVTTKMLKAMSSTPHTS